MSNFIAGLALLQVGDSLIVDGKTVYLADYTKAGNKTILFVANSKKDAVNPDGLHNYVDVTTAKIELSATPKAEPAPAAVVALPAAPRRVNYPDTEEGEEEFSAAFGEWVILKQQLNAQRQTEPAAEPVAEPVQDEPVQAEPGIDLVIKIDMATPPSEPTGFASWPNPDKFNSAIDYVAAVKKADPTTDLEGCKTFKMICLAIGIPEAKLANENARRVLIRHLAKYNTGAPKPVVNPVIKPTAKPVAIQPTTPAQPVAPVQPAPVAKPVTAAVEPTTGEDDVTELARLLRKLKGGNVDPEQVQTIIAQAVSSEVGSLRNELTELVRTNGQTTVTQRIEVVTPTATHTIDGPTHYAFTDIVTYMSIRQHLFLVGPAGSGKSTVCLQAAEALGLAFYAESVCAQTSEAKLLGFMSATGTYVRTNFREAYENGGVFLLDEIDNGNPNVLSVLNAALSNGFCAFGDGMVKRHADFVCVAAGNTYGSGANPQYVGRNPLDGALLDRFTFINFGYDETLETAIAGDTTWTRFVQAARAELKAERIIISPRATLSGNKAIAAGISAKGCVDRLIIKGHDGALSARILAIFNRYDW